LLKSKCEKKLSGLERLLQFVEKRNICACENGANGKFVAGTAREKESPTVTLAREHCVIGKKEKKERDG